MDGINKDKMISTLIVKNNIIVLFIKQLPILKYFVLTAFVGIAFLSIASCQEPDCPYESQFINVIDYGVIPDDSIDDTDSIRNVFLTIRDANKKATIFFPQGTYFIDPSKDKSMEIISNCTVVEGVKGQTIIKLMDNSIDSSLLCSNNYVRPIEECRKKITDACGTSVERMLESVLLGNIDRKSPQVDNHDIVIRNIIFDSNCRNNPLQDAPCYQGILRTVSLWGVNNLTIEHCEVINACSGAIVLVDCENSLIENNYIFDVGQGKKNGDGIQVNGSVKTIIKNNILENTGEGIFCQHWYGADQRDSDCVIENNIIRIVDYNEKCLGNKYPFECCSGYMQGDSTDFYCRRGKARGSSIGLLSQESQASNNLIQRHFPMTIHAQQRQADVETKYIKVFDNTFIETSKFNPSSGGAIWLSCDSNAILSDISIFRNKIVNSFASGIAFSYEDTLAYSGVTKKIEIKNNIIEGCCLGTVSQCAGILFQNRSYKNPQVRFEDIKIIDNNISNINRYAIWMDKGASQIQFTNNCFRNYKGALINKQCPDSDLACARKSISIFNYNSPLRFFELKRIRHLMPDNGLLNNYCIDCSIGSCSQNINNASYATLQNGVLFCQ